MTRFSRRRALSAALATSMLAGAGLLPAVARADFWGGDLPLLAGILGQSLTIVSQLGSEVTEIASEIKLLQTMVANLDHASFQSILQFVATARYDFNSLTWGVKAMGYNLARIDAEYKQLFPGDVPPPGTTVAQHRASYQAWHGEVIGAAQIASRQQTSLALLEAHAQKTQDLLNQSEAQGGQVAAQLQVIAQLIGITNTELLVLNQTLATTGRVLTSMAAATASSRQLALAKHDDAYANYTDKGPPVAVPHTQTMP